MNPHLIAINTLAQSLPPVVECVLPRGTAHALLLATYRIKLAVMLTDAALVAPLRAFLKTNGMREMPHLWCSDEDQAYFLDYSVYLTLGLARPKNYTRVGYQLTEHGSLGTITSTPFKEACYHDSCWRDDGVSFVLSAVYRERMQALTDDFQHFSQDRDLLRQAIEFRITLDTMRRLDGYHFEISGTGRADTVLRLARETAHECSTRTPDPV